MCADATAGIRPDEDRSADRVAIGEVLVAYCDYLDRMELDALADLFTAGCVVEFGPDERLNSRGRDALAKSLERMWRWRRTSHYLCNVHIAFSAPDAAQTTSYVLAWHERPDGSTATVHGQYRDRFEYRDSRWRIAARRMLMNGSDAGFTVNLFPLERRPAPAGWVAPDIDNPAGASAGDRPPDQKTRWRG